MNWCATNVSCSILKPVNVKIQLDYILFSRLWIKRIIDWFACLKIETYPFPSRFDSQIPDLAAQTVLCSASIYLLWNILSDFLLVFASFLAIFVCCHQAATTFHAQRKLYFHFLSHWMGYDRGDSFSSDFKPNGIQFGSKSKEKQSPQPYHIRFERKWKYSFLSVGHVHFWGPWHYLHMLLYGIYFIV